MNITLKEAETAVRALQVAVGEKANVREMAEAYIRCYALKKELEDFEKDVKYRLLDSGIEVESFPDLKKKVELREGNSRSEINSIAVAVAMAKKGIGALYTEITSVVKSKIDSIDANDEVKTQIKKIVDDKTTTIPGEPIVRIVNMTKEELRESAS